MLRGGVRFSDPHPVTHALLASSAIGCSSFGTTGGNGRNGCLTVMRAGDGAIVT
jgi:hypothetical protein